MSPDDRTTVTPPRPMRKRPKTYNLPDDVIDALDALAYAAHVSQSVFLEGLLREMPPIQAWLAAHTKAVDVHEP